MKVVSLEGTWYLITSRDCDRYCVGCFLKCWETTSVKKPPYTFYISPQRDSRLTTLNTLVYKLQYPTRHDHDSWSRTHCLLGRFHTLSPSVERTGPDSPDLTVPTSSVDEDLRFLILCNSFFNLRFPGSSDLGLRFLAQKSVLLPKFDGDWPFSLSLSPDPHSFSDYSTWNELHKPFYIDPCLPRTRMTEYFDWTSFI